MASKLARYAELLHDLPVGLSEWAVHPGWDNEESQTIDCGHLVRQTDYDFLTSAEAHELVRQEGITVIDYHPYPTGMVESRIASSRLTRSGRSVP
jgi:predicted glycoside hydrolase/deacetylase ChbG (UPF0249 family)